MSLESTNTRLAVGLMSGTSLDGVDAALARLSGTGASLEIELLAFVSFPYKEDLRQLLFRNSQPASSSVLEISQLNVRLSHVYADVVKQLLDEAAIAPELIDVIGCHGQTIYHVPDAEDCAGMPTRSTLQIGDPSTLANVLKTTVVGDFRLADMAYGGQGAPLVPYFDYVYFSDPSENRALLNIGGIGNLSVIPSEAGASNIIAFDTGPGNMVIDAVVQHFWGEPYDESGRYASSGQPNEHLLAALLESPYYQRTPPKSTGREYFNQAYVGDVLSRARTLSMNKPEDIVATVSCLTVETIAGAFESFIQSHVQVDRMIVSGGGVHNAFIMQGLADRLKPVKVQSMQDFGLNPDAKEALCFAVLAHETLNRAASNIPSATGASQPAILGKICFAS